LSSYIFFLTNVNKAISYHIINKLYMEVNYMKYRIVFLLISTLLLFAGCVKAPESVTRAMMKIDLSIVENKEVYSITFAGLLENVNNDTAFLDVKGTVELFDPAVGKTVESFDFTLPEVLPFGEGEILVKKIRTEKEITPLLELFEVEKEKLVSGESGPGMNIDQKNIRFKNLEYRKENIITLLKEKI